MQLYYPLLILLLPALVTVTVLTLLCTWLVRQWHSAALLSSPHTPPPCSCYCWCSGLLVLHPTGRPSQELQKKIMIYTALLLKNQKFMFSKFELHVVYLSSLNSRRRRRRWWMRSHWRRLRQVDGQSSAETPGNWRGPGAPAVWACPRWSPGQTRGKRAPDRPCKQKLKSELRYIAGFIL